jgi:hypothetical protein
MRGVTFFLVKRLGLGAHQVCRWRNMDETPHIEASVGELSAHMFDSPSVEVAGYQEYIDDIRSACNVIFGRLLDPGEFAELICAPHASTLIIKARRFGDDIELALTHKWFKGTHDYVIYVDAGKRVIEFKNIVNQPDAPRYLETVLFAHQVQSFREFGLDEIRLYAGGYASDPSGMIGYYVWARFGFVMSLDGFGSRLAAAGFEPADNTLDLFVQNGGAEWWYNNGSSRPAVFYLSKDSPCSDALQIYLTEKEVSVYGNDQEKNENVYSDPDSS